MIRVRNSRRGYESVIRWAGVFAIQRAPFLTRRGNEIDGLAAGSGWHQSCNFAVTVNFMATPDHYTDQGTLLLDGAQRSRLDSVPAWTQGEPDATVRRPRVSQSASQATFIGTIALAVVAVGVFGGAMLRLMDEPAPKRAAQASITFAAAAPPPPSAILTLPPPAVVTYEFEDTTPPPPPKAQPKRAKPKAR